MNQQVTTLAEKLHYILDRYVSATEVTRAFGFRSNTMISNMRKGNSNITTLHMEGLEKHFNIPMEIFAYTVTTKAEIDKAIREYRIQKRENDKKAQLHTKIFKQLEYHGLIPQNIFNKEQSEEKKLYQLIKEHKEKLQNQTSTYPCMQHSKNIFQKNNRLFQKLKGVWYGYLYPSNPASSSNGVWEVKTTINDDYSVVDYWGNRGYIKLGKHESIIIKESYDNDDLTIIRFSNRQVPSEHFRFVIISNQNNTPNEMVNFGFYSRKKYSANEAKEILGDINTKQLKLDLEFNDRLNFKAVVPQ